MEQITLGIPIYNVEDYVEKALLSALEQTYGNIEYILVDDKGNDNSMSIVKEIITTHPRGQFVKIIEHPHNIGLGAGRNTIIDHASGSYLFFMDSDDYISSDCISKLYEEMKKSDTDLVIGSYCDVFSDGISENAGERYVIKDNQDTILSNYNTSKYPVFTWNKLYKTGFLRENQLRCIPHQTIEDNFFSFQILLSLRSYSIIPDITYYYRRRNNSLTQNGEWNENIFIQWTEIFDGQQDYLNKKELPYSLHLKIKKKLFWLRFHVAKKCAGSKFISDEYIDIYLKNSSEIKDCIHSKTLLFAFWLSLMPLCIKKAVLSLHTRFMERHV